MIVYLPRYFGGAMKWIYEGYFNAWGEEGYEPKYYTNLAEIDTDSTYILMTTCGACHEQKLSLTSKVLNKASKVFMYVQSNKYPKPWGTHLNYITHCSPEFIQMVNSMESIKLWSFANTESVDYWDKWKTIKYLPLAFDNIGYSYEPNNIFKYDVCYVGGTADNAFNEKLPIMIEYFSELQKQGISTEGIFVNRNISLEAEHEIISNSKICLNIHDKYQQVLGLDCNERTFKSLGLNGFLISDKVECLSDFSELNIIQVESPKEMAEQVKEYLDKDLSIIKDLNRSVILENHTYKNRVRSLLCL
tara:strand:+ start:1913 stop:2824 length:912 start_codon:yes stop_codon:yes gene_type:complete